MAETIEIHPLTDLPEIVPGEDIASRLAEAIETADLRPRPEDILVVTQKIISKAEGRFVDLSTIMPGSKAIELASITRKDPRLVELILAESTAILRAVPNVLIARHRNGQVMANAGIDRSNIGGGSSDRVLLLPIDADASAERLAASLALRWGRSPGVVISDSFGRPWRNGVVHVALGVSGLPALIDRRGERDRDGRTLEVTQIALGDMIATAAGLAMGEGAEGVPAALMRGVPWMGAPSKASALVRPLDEDLFK